MNRAPEIDTRKQPVGHPPAFLGLFSEKPYTYQMQEATLINPVSPSLELAIPMMATTLCATSPVARADTVQMAHYSEIASGR
jgi:hypothetical protein